MGFFWWLFKFLHSMTDAIYQGENIKNKIRCYSLNISISVLLMSDKVDKYRVCKYNRAWYLRLLGSSWGSTIILNEHMFLYAFFLPGLLVKQWFGFIVNNSLISCYPLYCSGLLLWPLKYILNDWYCVMLAFTVLF